jgi:hypothetical protein
MYRSAAVLGRQAVQRMRMQRNLWWRKSFGTGEHIPASRIIAAIGQEYKWCHRYDRSLE